MFICQIQEITAKWLYENQPFDFCTPNEKSLILYQLDTQQLTQEKEKCSVA